MGNELQFLGDMKEFYESFGLVSYPFNVFTAENEVEYASQLFVHPLNYDSIKSSFDNRNSMVIRGNRGAGKTAAVLDLLKQSQHKDSLQIFIDDYSQIPLTPTNADYYSLIITALVQKLFSNLVDDNQRIKKLSRDEKLLLSFLLSKYTTQTTRSALIRKIENIQLSIIKRFAKKNINFFRVILNYGLTAGLNVVNDVIRTHLSSLPPLQESQIRDIMPEINLNAETDFTDAQTSYDLLLRTCALIKKLGYERITVFFDKFDEDSRMQNNAETISTFITPLFTDNKLLENQEIQIVISIWEVPFIRILTQFRSQKHFCPLLSWPTVKLKDALNRRLSVFSNGNVDDYRTLFADDVNEDVLDELFLLSNGNPRDLWHIMHSVLQAQYNIDSQHGKITEAAINEGLRSFVLNFNFYEYYPRKANAKSNSMDIYSYIKHLLKLTDNPFTKNQLNSQAKTGSSTSNYVYGMEKIGLVCNTNEKLNNGALYRISDPKVEYARRNNLDITKH